MSFTVTSRGTAGGSFGSTPSTGAFTPTAESLLTAMISATGTTPTISSISGHGTWAQIGSGASSGSDNIELWACITSASPSSDTVDFDWTDESHGFAYVTEISTDEAFDLVTLANNFGTPAESLSSIGSGAPHTIAETLSAFADSNNLTFVGGAAFFNADVDMSPDTGYTEVGQGRQSVSNAAVFYIASEDTSPSWIADTQNFIPMGIIAVEVKETASSGGNSTALYGGMINGLGLGLIQ